MTMLPDLFRTGFSSAGWGAPSIDGNDSFPLQKIRPIVMSTAPVQSYQAIRGTRVSSNTIDLLF